MSVNVVGNITLVKVMGVYGLAVATVIASVISVALLIHYLAPIIPSKQL